MMTRLLPALLVGTLLWPGIRSHDDHGHSHINGDKPKCANYSAMPPELPNPAAFTTDFQAGLQIYAKTLVIQCEGSVVGWKIVPQNKEVSGLYLAVFRPDPESMIGDMPSIWRVVGVTSVNNLEVKSPGQWTVVPVDAPIVVQPGDALGLYYEEYETVSSQLAVGIATPTGTPEERLHMAKYDSGDAIVFMRDAGQVQQGTELDASEADLDSRVGGIAAVFSESKNNPASCDYPLTKEDLCEEEERLMKRYTFYQMECREFNGCEREAFPHEGNNHPTKEACEANCARYLNPGNNANEQADAATQIAQAGLSSNEARARCLEPMRNSDWETCSELSERWHYNVYVDMCVYFDGCPPPTEPKKIIRHNNWDSKDQCDATCKNIGKIITGQE